MGIIIVPLPIPFSRQKYYRKQISLICDVNRIPPDHALFTSQALEHYKVHSRAPDCAR
jgi:hypothetical protein